MVDADLAALREIVQDVLFAIRQACSIGAWDSGFHEADPKYCNRFERRFIDLHSAGQAAAEFERYGAVDAIVRAVKSTPPNAWSADLLCRMTASVRLASGLQYAPKGEQRAAALASIDAAVMGLQEIADFLWSAERLNGEVQAAVASADKKPQTIANTKPVDEKTSWPQIDFDKALEKYKAERSARFAELEEKISKSSGRQRKAAVNEARKLFGRNALAKHFKCRTKTTVTNSAVFRALKEALQLERNGTTRKRRGFDQVAEAAAVTVGNPAVMTIDDEIDRTEAIKLARKELSQDKAEPIIEQLERGDTTPERAIELIKVLANKS